MILVQSTIRYLILAILMWGAAHGMFSSSLVTDKLVNGIVNDILVVGVPVALWLWSVIEKKAKSITLPNGLSAVVVNPVVGSAKAAMPLVALFALLLAGCAGITLTSVISDVKGWATGANVYWQDVNLKKTPAAMLADLEAAGVSASTAQDMVDWSPVASGVITITPSLVSAIDAQVKAASTAK